MRKIRVVGVMMALAAGCTGGGSSNNSSSGGSGSGSSSTGGANSSSSAGASGSGAHSSTGGASSASGATSSSGGVNCGDECGPTNPTYTECTCGASDACGWVGDGWCDAICSRVSSTPFTDTADCAGAVASCAGRCGESHLDGANCGCDADCSAANDCCADFASLCGGGSSSGGVVPSSSAGGSSSAGASSGAAASSSGGGVDLVTASELIGAWDSGCVSEGNGLYGTQRIVFDATTGVGTYKQYSGDTTCSISTSQILEGVFRRATWSLGTLPTAQGYTPFDMTWNRTTFTLLTATTVTTWNAYSGCGPFTLNTPKDILDDTCFGFYHPANGASVYDIAQITGTALQLGDTATGDMRTLQTRPTALHSRQYLRVP